MARQRGRHQRAPRSCRFVRGGRGHPERAVTRDTREPRDASDPFRGWRGPEVKTALRPHGRGARPYRRRKGPTAVQKPLAARQGGERMHGRFVRRPLHPPQPPPPLPMLRRHILQPVRQRQAHARRTHRRAHRARRTRRGGPSMPSVLHARHPRPGVRRGGDARRGPRTHAHSRHVPTLRAIQQRRRRRCTAVQPQHPERTAVHEPEDWHRF